MIVCRWNDRLYLASRLTDGRLKLDAGNRPDEAEHGFLAEEITGWSRTPALGLEVREQDRFGYWRVVQGVSWYRLIAPSDVPEIVWYPEAYFKTCQLCVRGWDRSAISSPIAYSPEQRCVASTSQTGSPAARTREELLARATITPSEAAAVTEHLWGEWKDRLSELERVYGWQSDLDKDPAWYGPIPLSELVLVNGPPPASSS